jgi:hypothetical protein
VGNVVVVVGGTVVVVDVVAVVVVVGGDVVVVDVDVVVGAAVVDETSGAGTEVVVVVVVVTELSVASLHAAKHRAATTTARSMKRAGITSLADGTGVGGVPASEADLRVSRRQAPRASPPPCRWV